MSMCSAQALDTSRTSVDLAKRSNREPAASTGGGARTRTRIKAVVNVGRVELEMLRTLKQHRSIEPLARFQARLFCFAPSRPEHVIICDACHV